jgi:hypothetical protein
MAKEDQRKDQRTLTNQPDPPEFSRSTPKRVRTQIHRRIKSPGPLIDQWDSTSGKSPEGPGPLPKKLARRSPPKRP